MAADPAIRIARLEAAIKKFIETVNASGGAIDGDFGYYVPAADPEWTDLGDAYIDACSALGVEPLLIDVPEVD